MIIPPRVLDKFYWNGHTCENLCKYKPGGYHPVHLGDMFSKLPNSSLPRYRVIHKLQVGFGAFSTVWLARDLSDDHKFVALKFNVACISDSNNESSILQWLKTQPLTHPGRLHVLGLLDSFFICGPNGKHEVLVTDVVVPLESFRLGRNSILNSHSRQICFQSLMGLAYLQECGVSHGDMHFGNLACAVPGLESRTEAQLLACFDDPECIPVLPRDSSMDTKFLPKYLIHPLEILDAVIDTFKSTPEPTICVKILDFGNAFRPTDTRPPPYTPVMIRAPEIHFNRKSGGIIDDDWGLKSDVWSLACTMHEIVDGFLIFEPAGREDALIRQMIRLCGKLPPRWQPYWDAVLLSTGEDPLVPDPEASWLQHRAHLFRRFRNASAEFVDGFVNLLRLMMCLDSSERPLASELLDQPWFDELRKPGLITVG